MGNLNVGCKNQNYTNVGKSGIFPRRFVSPRPYSLFPYNSGDFVTMFLIMPFNIFRVLAPCFPVYSLLRRLSPILGTIPAVRKGKAVSKF
jgi:hypothetical protein